jgi:hypothetical protein
MPDFIAHGGYLVFKNGFQPAWGLPWTGLLGGARHLRGSRMR